MIFDIYLAQREEKRKLATVWLKDVRYLFYFVLFLFGL